MDIFKKISALAMVLAVLFSLGACKGKTPAETDKPLVIITDAETVAVITSEPDTDAAETTGAVTEALTAAPDTTAAETAAAETTTAETTKAETTKAETTKAETTKAETTKAETTKAETTAKQTEPETTAVKPAIDKNGQYTSKDDVALYIHTYGKLPSNFITKKEAQALGWEGGSLEPYAKGKSIGGDTFGNYEGLLPKAKGRTYKECDIDTKGAKSRGAKRIVFSNDGLIFYTDDHYESFTQLY